MFSQHRFTSSRMLINVQYASEAGFYDAYNYQRMTKFFTWLTRKIHTEAVYRTVGVLELLNEPSSNASIYKDLNTAFYPQAIQVCNPKHQPTHFY